MGHRRGRLEIGGILAVGIIYWAVTTTVGDEPPPGPLADTAWPFDVVILTNGSRFEGLILAEDAEGMTFKVVSRPPGRPTCTLKTWFAKGEIAKVERLGTAERQRLQERLAELDAGGVLERQRMEQIELVTVDWPGQPDGARRYDSSHFRLIAAGSEELTRRVAVRLEQLYTAFGRFFPPRYPETPPTTIWLAVAAEDYRMLLEAFRLPPLLNPARFDPERNQIICGWHLRELGQQLQTARLQHAQQLAALAQQEIELRRLYRRPELDRHLQILERERKRIWQAERQNTQQFEAATARLFPLLYHEAFHAYVNNFVYPPRTPAQIRAGSGCGELPRWLNEGLAQVFETAVLEAGELRAEAPHLERLHRAQDLLRAKGKGLLPLEQLLTAEPQVFAAAHASDRAAADQAYLTSWALAYYLTFPRRLVGTPACERYLRAVNTGQDPRTAFAEWVGMPLTEFEKQFHADLLRLQSTGKLLPPP